MPSRRRPAKQSKGWEASLAHVVTIMRGPTLKTLAEARAYILKLPKGKQARWEIDVRCLLHAADSGSAEDIMAATRAIELAFCTQDSCLCRPRCGAEPPSLLHNSTGSPWTTWTTVVDCLDFKKCPSLLDSGRVGRLGRLSSFYRHVHTSFERTRSTGSPCSIGL
jgi:hypothetical protein